MLQNMEIVNSFFCFFYFMLQNMEIVCLWVNQRFYQSGAWFTRCLDAIMNVCLFLWLLFQYAGVCQLCQLCQLCHGKKNHSAAASRSHPSRQSSPNIDCKRFAPTLYWVIIVWLLGGYCAIQPLCLCNLFHIAIITSTKTYVRRDCYISLLASSSGSLSNSSIWFEIHCKDTINFRNNEIYFKLYAIIARIWKEFQHQASKTRVFW